MVSDAVHYTAADYKQAFLALDPLPENYLKMLQAHFNAPDHVITVTELADVVGYKSYKPVNLHYGKMADRVCEALNLSEVARPKPKLTILVTFYKPGAAHWQLTMRPEVATALKQLKWV